MSSFKIYFHTWVNDILMMKRYDWDDYIIMYNENNGE